MSKVDQIKILFLGDVVGRCGRSALKAKLPEIKEQVGASVTIVNGENSAGGIGINPNTGDEIFRAGADIITTGNHIWARKEIIPYLDKNRGRIIRPHNFAAGAPGEGYTIFTLPSGKRLAVINLMGRVFMPDLVDCPFQTFDLLVEELKGKAELVFVDFHAEATSEKVAFAYHADGRACAVVGTHTHVQTADERVFEGGLAYISDVGMCGPFESVIGVQHQLVVEKFRTGRPVRFEVAEGAAVICGVVITCDSQSGRATEILRLQMRL